MEIQLTKHQAFELAAFLRVPSKNFSSLSEARKCVSARRNFEKVIKDYSEYFKVLAKDEENKLLALQDDFRTWCETSVNGELPTKEQQSLHFVDLDRKVKELQKEMNTKGEEYEKTEGAKMIAITIDDNDKDFVKNQFDKEATKFSMWQDGEKLDEIAVVMERL